MSQKKQEPFLGLFIALTFMVALLFGYKVFNENYRLEVKVEKINDPMTAMRPSDVDRRISSVVTDKLENAKKAKTAKRKKYKDFLREMSAKTGASKNIKLRSYSKTAKGECESNEFPGFGPKTAVTQSDTRALRKNFEKSKSHLAKWLKMNRKKLGSKAYTFMSKRLAETQLTKSTSPDLQWRGISVWQLGSQKEPQVLVGKGFYSLQQQDPRRAEFEMTRTIAQGWAPCELEQASISSTWTGLLGCLNVTESNACAKGTYSEAAWAVSSSLAALVSPAKCRVPALSNKTFAQCVKRMSFHQKTASLNPEGPLSLYSMGAVQ